MSTLAQQLTDLVAVAASAAGHEDAGIPLEPCVPTNDPKHGDYQSNFAFRLGKKLRTNPRAVAQALVDALPANDLVASAEVAGPGFLNFRVTETALAAQTAAVGASATLLTPQGGAGKTLVIDYSSPNIAKRMHVGHLRSTIIGNALVRLYRACGWTVIGDNHIGDWGTQFGKLMVAWRDWRDEVPEGLDPIGELQWLYQQFGDRKTDELEDRARAETAKLQAGDPENTALWQQFVDISLAEFDGLYERLGIAFERTWGESHYRDRVQPLIDELLDKGIATHDQGAVVIPFQPDEGKGLKKNPLLIRKSDGAALYGTTDLATIELRLQDDAERIVYVTDLRQQLHFRQVFAAARKAGMSANFVHVYFGMLRFGDGEVMATRAGGAINLVDLLDNARAKARSVVDDKSPELSPDERAAIAEAVGKSAVLYADLSQNPQSDVIFSWDKMLALDGNTAPYLMYAHARCRSILRKAASAPGDVIVLGAPEERTLALAVSRTPEVIASAAALYRPNLLAEHLYVLAKALAAFWGACQVLRAEPDVRASRLALVAATAHSLKVGMETLGLFPIDRM